jgi:L-alanine-DL-glutamate epimerase-like enolase superfamily enzyme
MALGGLLPALDLARKADQLGMDCFVTTLIDGPVARAAAAHLAAALPRQSFDHGLSTLEMFEIEGPGDLYRPAGGVICIPDLPGLGYLE